MNLKTMLLDLRRLYVPLTLREWKAMRTGPKVLANSMPKAGTHLLIRALSLMPRLTLRWSRHFDHGTPGLLQELREMRRGQFCSAHLYWREDIAQTLCDREIVPVLILRDLRDVAVSNARYIVRMRSDHRLHHYFSALDSPDRQLMASIVGLDGNLLEDGMPSASVGDHARRFLPWLDHQACLVVRFEELIGSRGGGDDAKQITCVSRIAEHIGLALTNEEAAAIAEQVFYRRARTFRRGAIGSWKEHFAEQHKEAFKRVAGQTLIDLGYEDDFDW